MLRSLRLSLSYFFIAALSALNYGTNAYAGDHLPSKVTGTEINLFEREHTISGSILNRPLYGSFEHEPFGANVILRLEDRNAQFKIEKTGSTYSGVLISTSQDETIETSIQLAGVRKISETGGQISLVLDGQPVEVFFNGQTYENNHFQNITFSTEIAGKKLEFTFTGEACLGYASILSMMIVSSCAHISKY